MIIRIAVLSFCLLIGNIGCPATIPVITILSTVGVVANKGLDYKLTRESLNLKREELELKREQFEYEKEKMNES